MKKLFTVLSILIISCNNFCYSQSGADLQAKNNAFFKLNFAGVSYSNVYDNDGEKKLVPETKHFIGSVYGEYGLTDKWNLILNAPFLVMNKVNGEVTGAGGVISKVNKNVSSPGDFETGLKYQFINSTPWKVALGFFQGIGLGKNNQEIGLNTGFGDFNQELMFELQYRRSQTWYFRAMVAFNNHNKGYGDEANGQVEVNALPVKNLRLSLQVSGVQPELNGDKKLKPVESGVPISKGNFYGLYSQHSGEYLITPGINFQYNSLLGVCFAINYQMKGKNIYAAPLYSAGITLKMEKNKEVVMDYNAK